MLIIYHANCPDGFCCAWQLHHIFPNAEFVAASYGNPPPDVTNEQVMIVDFSYKRPLMESMIQEAEWVVVLDHHKTARAELEGLEGAEIVFDMEKSGGRLTQEWLKRNMGYELPKESRWIVDYTEDRDLWRFQLLSSHEAFAGLDSHAKDFVVWDTLRLNDCIADGRGILRYRNKIVNEHCGYAQMVRILGHTVPVLNATTLISEIGNELSKQNPFSLSYYDGRDGKRHWSLRSNQQTGLDVSEIAKLFGGGGHKNAAGFETAIGVTADSLTPTG